MAERLSRRNFLKLAGVASVGVGLAACKENTIIYPEALAPEIVDVPLSAITHKVLDAGLQTDEVSQALNMNLQIQELGDQTIPIQIHSLGNFSSSARWHLSMNGHGAQSYQPDGYWQNYASAAVNNIALANVGFQGFYPTNGEAPTNTLQFRQGVVTVLDGLWSQAQGNIPTEGLDVSLHSAAANLLPQIIEWCNTKGVKINTISLASPAPSAYKTAEMMDSAGLTPEQFLADEHQVYRIAAQALDLHRSSINPNLRVTVGYVGGEEDQDPGLSMIPYLSGLAAKLLNGKYLQIVWNEKFADAIPGYTGMGRHDGNFLPQVLQKLNLGTLHNTVANISRRNFLRGWEV